jgi:hypothetical protein
MRDALKEAADAKEAYRKLARDHLDSTHKFEQELEDAKRAIQVKERAIQVKDHELARMKEEYGATIAHLKADLELKEMQAAVARLSPAEKQ